MRIVALSGVSRHAGGLFYAVRSLCQALHERTVGVSVFGRRDSFADEDTPAWFPVKAEAFEAHGLLRRSPGMRRALRQVDCDLIHLHGLWLDDQWLSMQWQRETGKPVVVSPHGMLDPWAVGNSAWKKKLVGALFANRSLKAATCIHALCESEAQSIRAYGLKNPIALIPNGVDLPEIEIREPDTGRQKQLLFLGRIHPKKGLKELLQAWGGVSKDWKLLVAGWDDGGHEQGLKAQAESLGLGGTVEFIGSRFGAEKEALLRSVDAFILPSFSEGLPMSVLEAWSYGLPVVMTDFCNLPEGFDVGAAVRIEPEAESIFQGLEKLATLSDAELQDMGSKGRELVEEKFTWPQIAKNMRQVYEWCLDGGIPPECMQFD